MTRNRQRIGCSDRGGRYTLRGLGAMAPAGVLLLLVLSVPAAPADLAVLTPVVIPVPEQFHTGGAYTAIQAAPDGKVYLGTTFYDGFARFLVWAPGQREFQLVADMAEATGEKTPGPYAQAKIHTKPAIAPDGKVYFGTKSGKPADDERWQANYPGGHLLVYDPGAARVTDLGIPRPRQSIIAVGVDPRRNIIYALTDPEVHLITFNPQTRTFVDRGPLASSGPPTRHLVVLANGDVYHPAGNDAFVRYDAAASRMERVPLQFSGRGSYEVSTIGHGPYAMAANLDGSRFHGVGQSSGETYSFVPAPQSLTVLLHGRADKPEPGRRVIYYTMAAAPDGNVYYTAAAVEEAPEGVLYVLKLVTTAGRPEVVGRVAPIPPPPGWQRRYRPQTQGATVAPDGTLYVMLAYPLRVLAFPRLAARP